MTRYEINAFFPGFLPIYFGGLNYAVPMLTWLQGPFWEFFRARYGTSDLNIWRFRW
jgi:hypothetical protein